MEWFHFDNSDNFVLAKRRIGIVPGEKIDLKIAALVLMKSRSVWLKKTERPINGNFDA
jgi:hypothetical protein